MRTVLVIILCINGAIAIPRYSQRIIGGSVTTISQYPNIASLLFSSDKSTYWQSCGGTIINVKSVLTAAHCPGNDSVDQWRVRVGSTYANSGGVVLLLDLYIIHPDYDSRILDNDIAILRTKETIVYVNDVVRPATIAGSGYLLRDDEPVWAAGWGDIQVGGPSSEQLRHVQIWTVNQEVCANRYGSLGLLVTGNMLCAGWLDVGGRDQCQGDSGGPLYHDNVLVGICSWGVQCALAFLPGVNVRVSRYTTWLQVSASNYLV